MVGVVQPHPCSANGPLLVYDPRLSHDELALWLAYLGGRVVYREKHKLLSPPSGEIIPTFEEEVSARGVAAGFYSVMRKPRDSYWSEVLNVEKADFLRQYVWIYLYQPSWPAKERPRKFGEISEVERSEFEKPQGSDARKADGRQ